jgi:dehydrogenase/reductase SDR family member 7B
MPQMLKSSEGVRLIVVSSVIGLVATPTRTGYAASKFALKGFFDSLRCELVADGTKNTVTLAYPGAVRTEINASRLAGSGAAAALQMDKALTPDECATIMAEAHAAGERDVYYSMDGTFVGMIKSRLIMHLSFWVPNLADTLIVMTMKQMTKK